MTTGIALKNLFYNSLVNRYISGKNHEPVFNILKAFKMKTIKDYHDLYRKYQKLISRISEVI